MASPTPESSQQPPPKTHAAVTGQGSALQRYMSVFLGEQSLTRLLYFEFCSLMSPLPGILGLGLRKLFWPRLFGACGKGTVFGAGVKLMQPGRIHLGRRVVISDNCILDARNQDSPQAIELGDDVMLSHGVMISCKDGNIRLEEHTGVGAYTVIQSTRGNPVTVGADTILGPRCYITGGGNYNTDRLDIPIARQGLKEMGGTQIGAGAWLGAGVSVLGGITIGRDSIVGTGSVVSRSLPELSISVGVPARVVRSRNDNDTGSA